MLTMLPIGLLLNVCRSHQQSNGSDNTAVIAVLGVVIVLLLVLLIILILERQGRIPKIGKYAIFFNDLEIYLISESVIF